MDSVEAAARFRYVVDADVEVIRVVAGRHQRRSTPSPRYSPRRIARILSSRAATSRS